MNAHRASIGDELWRTNLPEEGEVNGFALTQGRSSNTLVVVQPEAMHGLVPSTGAVDWTYTHDRNPFDTTVGRTSQPAIYDDYVFQVTGGSDLVAVSLSDGTEK